MRKRYTSEQRSALVEMVRAERTTVSEAAARLGVTTSTAYLWMRQADAVGARRGNEKHQQNRYLSPRTVMPPNFVRVVRSGDLPAAILVRVGSAEVEVRRGFDADLLRAVVRALQGAAE
jgi:transposase-like protein